MKICRDNIQKVSEELLAELTQINKKCFFEGNLDYNYLVKPDFNQWDEIRNHFIKDFTFFEKLLFKIHFKRNKELKPFERKHILMFLFIGYYYSEDVRYFNEFLFFADEKNTEFNEMLKLIISAFFTKLDQNNIHKHPVVTIKEVNDWINKHTQEVVLKKTNTPINIGLIGNPLFFKKIKQELSKLGYKVNVYLVKYHRNSLINFIMNFPFFWTFLKLFKFVPKFITLDYNSKSPNKSLEKKLETDKNIIGFHKLGFIIKENIYNKFSKGLLNDHWGILPFIRGRSTIEYSLLFGFKVCSTLHLIKKEIDEGDIVSIHCYDIHKKDTISSIRKRIKKDLSNRVVKAINIYHSSNYQTIENNPNKGLTYYEIHPLLKEFIDLKILKTNKN